jgi:hypothetical protein
MKTFLFSFFVFFNIGAIAQNVDNTFSVKFEHIVHQIIHDNYRPFSLIRDMDAENMPDSLLPLLRQYEVTPNPTVQDCIYESYFEYGITSKSEAFKKEMMNYLLGACARIDSIELSYSCHEAINFLIYFSNNLFDKEMIDVINKRAEKNNRAAIDYAYLSGKLYQRVMIPVFKKQLQDAIYSEIKYKLSVILARLGDKKSITTVKDSLQKMYIEDRLLTEKVFLYTRKKPIVNILFQDLESNQKETSYYEEWMTEPLESLYANRALHILTMLIKDFPVKTKDDLNYTKDDLNAARKWTKKHINNYEIIEE